jgi:alkylated DNA repair protein (DNA oxidative demethylase)
MRAAVQRDLFAEDAPVLPEGVTVFRGRVSDDEIGEVLDAMLGVLDAAPPYRPQMRTGAYVINALTNCGAWGWHSDAKGYRYVDRHPVSGEAWPPIPEVVARIARAAAAECGEPAFEPDACLVNLYAPGAKLNLHQDHDETDFRWPIVSFSFGSDAVFVAGGQARRDPVTPVTLSHGDVMVMHGPGRLMFHGVTKIIAHTSPTDHPSIPPAGRLNLTLRRAK